MSILRLKLAIELEKISGLKKIILHGKHEGFTCFEYKGKEVAHFDNNNELDVRLGKELIKQQDLAHPRDSKNHPHRYKTNSNWIVLQFRRSSRIDEIIRLVKLAIDHS